MDIAINLNDPYEWAVTHCEFEREQGVHVDDIVPVEDRLAIALSEDDIEAITEFLDDGHFPLSWQMVTSPEGDYTRLTPVRMPIDSIGWDINRFDKNSSCGQDQFHRLLIGRDEDYCANTRTGVIAVRADGTDDFTDNDAAAAEREAYVSARFESFNRKRLPTDLLLIDLADDAIHQGWDAPPSVLAAIDTLRTIAANSPGRREVTDRIERHRAEMSEEDRAHLEYMAAWQAWEKAEAELIEQNGIEHQAWQATVDEYQATRDAIVIELGDRWREGRDAMNNEQKARVDHGWKRNEKAYADWDAILPPRPVDNHRSAFSIVPETPMSQASTVRTMLPGTQAICDLGIPIVERFNRSCPVLPDATGGPILPENIHTAPLRLPLQKAIHNMVALADRERAALRFADIAEVLAVLSSAHQMSLEPIISRIRSTGAVVAEGKLKSAVAAFETEVMQTVRTGHGWILDSKGANPDPWISENVDVLLSRIKTDLRYNVFARQKEFTRNNSPWRALTDDDMRALSFEARSVEHRLNVSKSHLTESITTIARRRTYDPLTDYIDSLRWDGVKRLDSWLTHTCGVPTDAYHAAVSRNVIGGMVKRARHPGAKHDTILLLISRRQGTGKSSLARALLPDDAWFIDKIDLKQSQQNLLPTLDGRWIAEWAELAGLRKTEVEDVKSFLTRQSDNYTKKYDAIAGDHPRRFIFIATTNDETPLRDDTGNRRFLPVRVRWDEIDLTWLKANRDSLIAEAAHYDAAGDDFNLPREVWGIAAEHQSAARATTPMESLIDDWFSTPGRFWVSSSDMTEALRHHGIRDNRIGHACELAGLRDERFPYDGKPQNRVWAKANTTVADPRVTLQMENGAVKWKWPMVLRTPVPPPPPY